MHAASARRTLALADVAALVVGHAVAVVLHQRWWPMPWELARDHLLLAAAAFPAWIAAMLAVRFFTARANDRRADEWRHIVAVCVTGAVGTALVAYAIGFERRSSHWIWTVAAVVGLALAAERELARRRFRRLRRAGRLRRRVVIVGADAGAVALARKLERSPELGYEPVGMVRAPDQDASDAPLPVLGDVARTPELVTAARASGAVLSLCSLDCDTVNDLTRRLSDAGCHVALSTGLDDIDSTRLRPMAVDGRALLYVEPCVRTGWHATAKRVFDLLIAGTTLLLTAPVLLVAAIAIKLDTPGPVLFRQVRVGRDGRPFEMLKLRTMCVDAEQRRAELLHRNEADGPMFKLRDDPRVTRVGRFLRRCSIDELPQCWNVLRGDMSVVGPRPALPVEVDAWPDEVRGRLRVLPGITGMWQVCGRSDTSFDDYVRLDLAYVDNWSLAHDLEIVARTVGVVLNARGAR